MLSLSNALPASTVMSSRVLRVDLSTRPTAFTHALSLERSSLLESLVLRCGVSLLQRAAGAQCANASVRHWR